MTLTQTFSHATLVLDFDAWRLQLTVPRAALRPRAPWGEPSNLYDPVVTGALYLACARLEADPGSRANASIAPTRRAT